MGFFDFLIKKKFSSQSAANINHTINEKEYCKRYRKSDGKCINPDEADDKNNSQCSTDPTNWKNCGVYKMCMQFFPQKW